MVLKTRRNSITAKINCRRTILANAVIGAAFLVIPVAAIFVDPLFLFAKYKLRLTKNSVLYDFLKKELEGARLAVYIFNVTNAEQFLSGEDKKMKMDEIGPFVYQEYRSNVDLEMDSDASVIKFTPKLRTVFIPEESIGDPKDIVLNVPNISLLSITTLMQPYPFWMRQLYNVLVDQVNAKGIVSKDVHSILWGSPDPLVGFAKNIVPGLIYFDSIGVFERLYDKTFQYRIEMGTEGADKFKVKKLHRTRAEKMFESGDLLNVDLELNDTYEGAAFPPLMTPETPVNLYRLGVCRSVEMKYQSQEQLKMGARVFIYGYNSSVFENTKICDSKGWCPYGLMDISNCFFGLPIVLSKAHFLDADPLLLEEVEGLKPIREEHDSSLIVDPKLGLTIGTTLNLQLNVLTKNLDYNYQSRIFSDTVVPLVRAKITLPEQPSETKYALNLLYKTGPQILLSLEILSCCLGILLLLNSARLAWQERCRRSALVKYNPPLQAKISAQPLLET